MILNAIILRRTTRGAKQRKNSLAATLCAGTPATGFEIEDDKSHSEIWIRDYMRLCLAMLSTAADRTKASIACQDEDTGGIA